MNDEGRRDRWRGLATLLWVLCFVISGCSSSSTPIRVDTPLDPTHEKLMKIGMAYARFSANHKRPPQAWADLSRSWPRPKMPTSPGAPPATGRRWSSAGVWICRNGRLGQRRRPFWPTRNRGPTATATC